MADTNDLLEQLQNFNISDVDWDRVGVWPLAGRIFLFVMAVVAILAAVFFLMVKDKNKDLEGAVRVEADLKSKFEGKAFEAANLVKYRQQMKEMEASFEALKKQLPKDTEVPGLLEDIDEKGVDARLDIKQITLLPEVTSEFYVELPIQISVEGGYHEFGAFVSGVAGMARIVTLHDYSITTRSSSRLSMKIDAKTYRYKEQE